MRRRIIEREPDGAGDLHIGVVAAEWNHNITSKLVDGALARLESLGVREATVLWVPGSLELPVAAQRLAEEGCDAVVAIGVVIKGDTDHYQIVAFGASEGIQRVALDEGIPICNAILAVHDVQDAVARAAEGSENKGDEAALAAVGAALALRGI